MYIDHMIPDSRLTPQGLDWKVELGQSFRQVKDLLDFCAIDAPHSRFNDGEEFPLRVTRHFASLIEKGNALDPLLLQVLPDQREQQQVAGFVEDAVGDQAAMVAPGLIHKYAGRALLTATPACAIHCRYCFRRHHPYHDNRPDFLLDGPVMKYLSGHPDIHELILSGGDPLMLDDHKLLDLIHNLNTLPHIRLLRIHSRLLSVLPARISEQLISVLQKFNGEIVLVTHINHANEIHPANRRIFRKLSAQGFRLFNQSVLLKRVNDDTAALKNLSFALIDSAISPYYLHCLDKVRGAAHFDIPPAKACHIYRQLRDIVPGYLLPRLVREVPGQSSKSTVHCD